MEVIGNVSYSYNDFIDRSKIADEVVNGYSLIQSESVSEKSLYHFELNRTIFV